MKHRMKNNIKSDGIFLAPMELPHLAQLAEKRSISGLPKKAGTLGGPYLSKLKGRGMEFAEARPYQPGDDVRHIDWRVTARTGKTHTKLFREERERPVLLVLDQIRSMFFGSRQRLKSVQAARFAAVEGWRALSRGDRVGGVLFSENVHREFRPKGDRRHFLRFLSKIREEHNRIIHNMSDHEWQYQTDSLFAKALARVRYAVQPGSLVYIFSDFSSYDADCRKHLFQLSKHNQVKAIHFWDPLEKEIPVLGRFAMSDGDTTLWINSANKNTKQNYTASFEQYSQFLQTDLRRCGVDLKMISTVDPLSQIY